MTTRPMHFSASCAGLAPSVLAFRGVETLDRPYELTFEVAVPRDSADPSAMLGRDFAFDIESDGGPVASFRGVVRAVTQGDAADGARVDPSVIDAVVLRVEVVPALWFLGLSRRSRIFQEMTALEIVQEVLEEKLAAFSRTIEIAASGSYPKREHCVQYQESDLDFVHRLLEEEGIAYAFTHEGETETMILTDGNQQLPEVVTAGGSAQVPWREERSLGEWSFVSRFSTRLAHTTTSVAVRDQDWTGPANREAEERGADARGRDRESYEHGRGGSLTIGDYGGVRYRSNDAARQALIRREMHLAGADTAEGEGRTVGMHAGRRFDLVDHPVIGADGSYLLSRVEHDGQSDPRLGSAAYQNRFACLPASVPWRPVRRTPKPRVSGFETAKVTGPAGQEIHTDEHGRIKVQLHWDREGASDERSSCFVRVRQAWAGESWGFVFVPRIGMEVVLAFVDGDPDRPIVTGCLYDGAHAPPYPLPDEKTKSTIKSQSSLGGGGFNELRFEDKAGSEQVFTHAQKDQNEVVLANHTTDVGGDQSNVVGATQTQTIHKNQTERVKGEQKMDVGTDRTVHVLGSFDETIEKGETRKVDGGVQETITSFESRTVTGGLTDDITGKEVRIVGTKIEETVTGPHEQTVTGASAETMASGSTQTVSAGPVTYDSTSGGMKIKSGGPMTFMGMAGIHYRTVNTTKVYDNVWNWEPIYGKAEAGKNGSSTYSVSFYAAKIRTFAFSLSAGAVSVGATGIAVGNTAIKTGLTGLKIDLVGSKDEKTGVKIEPIKFLLTL